MWLQFFQDKVVNKVSNISEQNIIWSHQKLCKSANPTATTTKFLQLLATIGVLPSGLWQWSDSGTPFTLEDDPPCGGIYGRM